MEKRMVAAIALSLLVLLVFQFTRPKQPAVVQPAFQPLAGEVQGAASAGSTQTSQTRGSQALEASIAAEEKLAQIKTEKYNLAFSNIGGTLKSIALREYQDEEVDEVLLDEENPILRPFSLKSGFLMGLESADYEMKRSGEVLEYKYSKADWLEVTKMYTVHKSLYCIELELLVKNTSSREIPFSYQIIGPSELRQGAKISGRSFLEADTMIDGKIWKLKAAKGSQEKAGIIEWTALKNRYFTVLLKPLNQPQAIAVIDTPNQNMVTVLKSPVNVLKPGETLRQQFVMYAGPLTSAELATVGEDIQGIIDYGFFGGISKALLSVLRFFHKVTHNWGLAIILMTLVINVLLFPLTIKSFTSMHQMKNVQPHIQKLKELHKDNPQKLNKETMELYKKYNVNPLGGCLPLLLQMPIFIALYQGLMRSIELKGASFLWISNLAKPDAVLLPVSLPLIGNHINILPLLMVAVMALQQKFSQGGAMGATDEQASQQRMMMVAMPIFFGFLFYNMPSGLVLYWLTNTILMTIEQKMISQRMAHE